MAKSKSKSAATSTTASAPGKDPKVAASSIDDIFAKPAKTKLTPATASSSSTSKPKSKSTATSSTDSVTAASSSKAVSAVVPDGEAKKKKKKKNKVAASFDPAQGDGDDGADVPAPTASASRVVEVVDPSLPKPQTKVELPAAVIKKGKKRDRKDVEEDEAFKDSRGDGPRRKTEEGFLIYKEAELNIDPEAGGTPLCPFDCDCCF